MVDDGDLLALVYVSCACGPLPAADIDAMLALATRRNRDCGVSGLLVFDGGTFMQCLEGPAPAVLATFERIRVHPWHQPVTELLRCALVRREFADWPMAYLALAGCDPGGQRPSADEQRAALQLLAHPATTALMLLSAFYARRPLARLRAT